MTAKVGACGLAALTLGAADAELDRKIPGFKPIPFDEIGPRR